MPTMSGQVLIVQEGRLHLLDDQGAGHLFILGRKDPAETWQLHALGERQARVRVRYSEMPNVIGLVADRIEVLDGETPA